MALKTYSGPLPETYDFLKAGRTTLYVMKRFVDFTVTANNLDAGEADVLPVLPIRAGETVLAVWCEILTAEAANASVDIGTGDDVDYFWDGLELDAQPHTASEVGTAAVNKPLYFSAADTIDMKATTDTADVNLSTGKLNLCALICRTN
jgi:hypothetical protein